MIFTFLLIVASIPPIINGTFNQNIMESYPSKKSIEENTIKWFQKQKLIRKRENMRLGFGRSVSIDDEYAIVGENGYFGGAAHIFQKNNSTWEYQAFILPPDGEFNNHFGNSVSIEGETVLIGESSQGYWFYSDYGSAYVFKKDNNGQWNQQDKLNPLQGSINDFFGCSVSLDGDTALIGASGDNKKGVDTGSAYIFKYNGTNWNQQEMLLPNDIDWGDNFGYSVSLDGDTALVGAPNDDGKGSAYIFKYNGTNWNQQVKLIPLNESDSLKFGYSVSLNGSTALIGAPGNYKNQGSAFIFKYDGILWIQQAKLITKSHTTNTRFGCSVSLDGDTALIGKEGSDIAYVFKRNGSTWSEEAKLYPLDESSNRGFGCSVSLDGGTAFIGAPGGDEPLSGSAYIFVRDKMNPFVKIVNPKKSIYIDGVAITPYFFPFIIGNIEIQATAEDDLEIELIEFYVNEEFKANFTEHPYNFLWNEIVFGKFVISAIAYDSVGKIGKDKLTVIKLF